MSALPSISVCIPVYNGVDWLAKAIESALTQTRDDLEVVVVDNGSTDGSDQLAERYAEQDGRVRVVHFWHTIGAISNHNRCIELARGEFLKFLHHDDVLHPHCVERMAVVLEEHPNVGLVFCRREILLDRPDDPAAQAWKEQHAVLHEPFGDLGEVNDGRELLRRYLSALQRDRFRNWIGEPSAVMVRRSCFEPVGHFNPRVNQSFDIEMWLRLMARADVGFVDEPLVAFRHHAASLSAGTAARHDDWLDLLWIYESLLDVPALEEHHAMLRSFRRRELARVFRRQLGRVARRDLDFRPLGGYAGYRLLALSGSAPPIPV